MSDRPRTTLTGAVLDARDIHALADFWQALLGWDRAADEEHWVKLVPPGGGAGLAFQDEPLHRPPVWPSTDRDQMQIHLDVEVDDLTASVEFAESLGATLADFQPQDDVRVLYDVAGHPFCLWVVS